MFTNSKSGSFFFYSSDFRFILKTCTKREVTLTNTLTLTSHTQDLHQAGGGPPHAEP